MKFTWLSNAPWAATGYGNQTKLFVPRLQAAGHEVSIIAFYGHEGTPININGVPVYGKGHHPYGQDVMTAHTIQAGGQFMISLMDAWVMEPKMLVGGLKWIPWFPVDMQPLPPPITRNVEQAFKRIVFSRFGEKMVHDAGLDCYYVPHGIDTKTFQPLDQVAARSELGFPYDRFIVGMVAANKGTPSRKALSQHLEAFSEFRRRHPDALLYLHTSKAENGEHGGINLPEICDYLGLKHASLGHDGYLDADVLFCDQYHNLLGFPDDYMCKMYSSLDVHILVSMGEGFGIPTVEAQACGCPVIVSGWTASKELCFSGLVVDEKHADKWWTPLAAYQWVPRAGAIASALREFYRKSPSREKARSGALEYDADKVTSEYWLPVLGEIENELAQ